MIFRLRQRNYLGTVINFTITVILYLIEDLHIRFIHMALMPIQLPCLQLDAPKITFQRPNLFVGPLRLMPDCGTGRGKTK